MPHSSVADLTSSLGSLMLHGDGLHSARAEGMPPAPAAGLPLASHGAALQAALRAAAREASAQLAAQREPHSSATAAAAAAAGADSFGSDTALSQLWTASEAARVLLGSAERLMLQPVPQVDTVDSDAKVGHVASPVPMVQQAATPAPAPASSSSATGVSRPTPVKPSS
jgi:hypothetical protein